eukprot:TRINITY_DN3135_c0_g1_i3.p2 TRINITY_DN3135_c0_g1~~TRINITY_DN3135_c0_g1_i3.p2  ORF type:complete len:118 (+),score=13.49 TRINITY_DN3135_c0_g1_i3:279-632(+)
MWRFCNVAPHRSTVLAATAAGEMVAVDTRTGAVKWRFDSGRPLFSARTVAPAHTQQMFIPSSDGSVYAITPEMPLTVPPPPCFLCFSSSSILSMLLLLLLLRTTTAASIPTTVLEHP